MSLLKKALLVANELDGDVAAGVLVVGAAEDLAKRALAKGGGDLVAKGQVVVWVDTQVAAVVVIAKVVVAVRWWRCWWRC